MGAPSVQMSGKAQLVWAETWNFFELYVTQDSEGYHSVVKAPWDNEATKCVMPRLTMEGAKRRCFGMVRGSCELMAAKAAGRMLE